MDVYLIRSAESDGAHVTDPYSAPLTPAGQAQAERLAQQCRGWDVQFLCASTMRRAQDTADAIARELPEAVRWDVQEIEDVTVDDLMGDPTASQLVSKWTEQQRERASERVWIRTMSALARITIYARSNDLANVAVVSHALPLHLLLLNWMGRDWRALDEVGTAPEHGSVSLVRIREDGGATIEWINES